MPGLYVGQPCQPGCVSRRRSQRPEVEAKRYMEAGEYVPDEVTNSMVAARLAESDAANGLHP